jgi:5,10-methylene-tetrahydrofolate dehydrogenase/methenyl tetrahydrofolate cyclohydrolase
LGIHFDIYKYQPDINQLELIEKIKELNFLVDGLMIQLLLPADFDRQEIIRATDPDKDVYSDEMVVVGANFIPNSQF